MTLYVRIIFHYKTDYMTQIFSIYFPDMFQTLHEIYQEYIHAELIPNLRQKANP